MRLKPTNAPPERASTARLPYLPALDGLRALAIGAVLLYHADLDSVPGGFLGVEVFFVISGYLITSLLLSEWQRAGRIDVAAFWLRRARRLLPALYVLLASVLAFTVLFLPEEVAGLRNDALAAAGYATNWYLIVQQKSYFETVGRPPLLQHLWSLAVEEQFYLLWPPLLLLGLRAGRKPLLAGLLLGALASAGLMAAGFQPDTDPSRLYYATDTRAAGLLLGAALACLLPPSAQRASGLRLAALADLAGAGALALLIYWFATINEFQSFLYQGGLLCVALATTVAIAAVARPRAGLLPRLLSAPPLRWLGLRSYSLYLWHWPVFMVTRAQLDVDLTGLPLLGLRFAIAALLAELSYRLIETPFRTGAVARAWRRFVAARGALRWQLGMRWLAGAAVFMGMCVLLGRAVVNAQPPAAPAYLADATPTPLGQAAPAAEDATPAPPPAGNAAEATATPPADLAHGFMLEAPTLVSTYRQASAQAATPAPAPTLAATPAALGSVVAIGDSVMAGAVKPLGSLIAQIDVDAVRGRQAAAALKLLQERHDAGRLGDVVIIHIGNNGPFSQGQFDAMMQLLADVRQVVFVNVKVPRRWEAPNNAVIADGVQRYPNALLVDWHGATANRPELFWRDGIHLRPSGAQFYADLIAGSVRDSAARLGAR